MKMKYTFITLLALFLTAGVCFGQTPEESALSWKKNAKDTRAKVVSVAEELGSIGDKGNKDAKELIDEAHDWLAQGDKKMEEGDRLFKEESFEKASYSYNMAWQYYVKAATSGLNARRILTGK